MSKARTLGIGLGLSVAVVGGCSYANIERATNVVTDLDEAGFIDQVGLPSVQYDGLDLINPNAAAKVSFDRCFGWTFEAVRQAGAIAIRLPEGQGIIDVYYTPEQVSDICAGRIPDGS